MHSCKVKKELCFRKQIQICTIAMLLLFYSHITIKNTNRAYHPVQSVPNIFTILVRKLCSQKGKDRCSPQDKKFRHQQQWMTAVCEPPAIWLNRLWNTELTVKETQCSPLIYWHKKVTTFSQTYDTSFWLHSQKQSLCSNLSGVKRRKSHHLHHLDLILSFAVHVLRWRKTEQKGIHHKPRCEGIQLCLCD